MIYLDNAATSFYRPPEVAAAVVHAMETVGNSARGVHSVSLAADRTVYAAREAVSALFGAAGPEQTAFAANATQSLNTAIKGLLEPGDLAVSTVLEHNSVLRPLYEMEKKGVRLCLVGCDSRGRMDYQKLKDVIFEKRPPKMVICTHASNVTGNLTDLRKIGAWCRERGVLFVVDAAQTAGIFDIHMENMNIDVLCFTGHKGLLGPQGTGGLCVRKGLAVRPLITGGSGIRTFSREHPPAMPTALEAGTLNAHGIAGLLAGIRWIEGQGMEKLRKKEQSLARAFYEGALRVEGVRVLGDFSSENRAAVVSLNLWDADSAQISDYLAQEFGILTRSGGHCAPLLHEALGTGRQGAVRFSFSHFNTIEQVNQAIEAVKKTAALLSREQTVMK